MEALSDPWYRHIVALQDCLQQVTVQFWSERGVRAVNLPITTGSISSPMGLGSDSSPVQVELLGVPTYLADSMQFALEYGCRFTERGCYYVMPSFRGEDADATHLCQFFHSEAEIPGGFDDVVEVVGDYLRAMAAGLLVGAADDVRATAGSLDHIAALAERTEPFARVRFDEAVALLGGAEGLVHTDPDDGWRTLTRRGEQQLMAELGEFVWVTHWDHLAVPFYQAYEDQSAERHVALNGDLLFGIGEIVGAGERHQSSAEARAALAEHEVGEREYDWYLTMRDVSPLRTAGFGLGMERFIAWIVQHDDIRDLQLLPRFNGVESAP
ncbi:MAG TPA: amino acid--tRNA ligase-related protein [Solirubrobacterales bacterium]|nr:amino acid--tRNA ligase-related protein [Solirubrobacterales bacterium]